MATKVFVYNEDNNDMEVHYLEESDNMPYATEGSMRVEEFRGSSTSPTIWTTKGLMECWNVLREQWGSPIGVRFAFKRLWEGGHGAQSQHYAGTAMDMAQDFSNEDRNDLRTLAELIGCFVYVEPAYLTPTWVHVDRRLNPPACAAGYIMVKEGSINTYVLILQDALNTLGFTGAGFDGVFGAGTRAATIEYQESRGLSPDGIVGCQTWMQIASEVRGIGSTDTTIL